MLKLKNKLAMIDLMMPNRAFFQKVNAMTDSVGVYNHIGGILYSENVIIFVVDHYNGRESVFIEFDNTTELIGYFKYRKTENTG